MVLLRELVAAIRDPEDAEHEGDVGVAVPAQVHDLAEIERADRHHAEILRRLVVRALLLALLGRQAELVRLRDRRQPLLHRVDRVLAEIARDPPPTQFLRHRRRRAGPAERVHDEVAGIAAGKDDPFEKRLGFLRGVVLDLNLVGRLSSIVRCSSRRPEATVILHDLVSPTLLITWHASCVSFRVCRQSAFARYVRQMHASCDLLASASRRSFP